MKLSPTTVVLALVVTAAGVLPISDIHRTVHDRSTAPRFEPGRGDYPGTAGDERLVSDTPAPKIACITPDVPKRYRHNA